MSTTETAKQEKWSALDLSALPEGCVAVIISGTSPRDAGLLTLVCRLFKSAAESDPVWEHFLPEDYKALVPESLCHGSKKDLYLRLCEKPILIDHGRKSFSLDKWSGKKCFMLSSRELQIVWGDTPRYWKWTSLPESRFPEVAELLNVCWLEIRGRIRICMLSPMTHYKAYLVFKVTSGASGLAYHPAEVRVGLAGTEGHKQTVYLEQKPTYTAPRRLSGVLIRRGLPQASLRCANGRDKYPKKREDKWSEIELGEFFNQEAIKSIDTKKASLKKAFDDLQSKSDLLSSFCLSWSDLDSHFASVQNAVTHRFKLLESLASSGAAVGASAGALRLAPCSAQSLASNHSGPSPSTTQFNETRVGSVAARPSAHCASTAPSTSTSVSQVVVDSVVARPELRGFCESMDSKGLSKYISDHLNERESIKLELPAAFRCAPEAGRLVLDALAGVSAEPLGSSGTKDEDPYGIRKSGVLLLECLMGIGASSSSELRERAKKVAFEWKKIVNSEQKPQAALCFVYLVAAYGLKSEFDVKELVDPFILATRCRNATTLCHAVDFSDVIPDLVQKLLDTGKKILAVKFIFDFGLSEKFPPVLILKAHMDEAQQIAKKVYEDGNSSLQLENEAKSRECSALKAVIRVIEEQKLQAEYPPEPLKKRVEQLEKKADKKRIAMAPGSTSKHKLSKQQMRKQQQGGIKRLRTSAPVVPVARPLVASVGSTVQPFQQSHQQPPGLLHERSAAYLSSASGVYGIAGSSPRVAPYTGSSAGFYGLAATPQCFPENSNPAGYYDGSSTYNGYGLPSQYHQSYHPR